MNFSSYKEFGASNINFAVNRDVAIFTLASTRTDTFYRKNFNCQIEYLECSLKNGRMPMEDDELEKIRDRKLREMIKKPSEKRGIGREKVDESTSMGPVEVTEATFIEVIKSHPVVVVDCWAPWCPPCRILSPILDELAKDYAGKILFGKLNVDENQRISLKYGIMSIPTLLIFKNGNLVDRIVGAMPRNMLEQKITSYL